MGQLLDVLVNNAGIIKDNNICSIIKEDPDIDFNFDIVETQSGVLSKTKTSKYNIFISDIDIKGLSPLDVFRSIKILNPTTLIVIISDLKWERLALNAIKERVVDYLIIPYSSYAELKLVLIKAGERFSLHVEKELLRKQLQERVQFHNIIGKNHKMQEIYNLISNIADKDITVLIGGESGTGKDLVAQAIHYNSFRKNKAFVKMNCAAIPDELIESELFGHEKGSFTGAYSRRPGKFEQAHGGTIFLDEIGDMSLATQAKVLRVIENKEFERIGGKETIKVDVRIITATNKDLVLESQLGRFREDLFYRLNVVSILLPPLRERKEDILLLTDYFLTKFNAKFGKQVTGFSFDVMSYFHEYSWPGNIREMQNVIESAVALSMNDTIDIGNLPYKLGNMSPELPARSVLPVIPEMPPAAIPEIVETGQAVSVSNVNPVMLEQVKVEEAVDILIERKMTLNDVEELMIKQAMKKASGIQKDAAKMLGLGKGGIQYKMRKHGITISKVVN